MNKDNVPSFLKVQETHKNDCPSKTPNKLFPKNNLDDSTKLGSKTPIKYKPITELISKETPTGKISQHNIFKTFKNTDSNISSKAQ